jgi:methylthioribose-1-phosphate isomerase
MAFKTLEWKKGKLFILDQTKLPGKELYLGCSTDQEVAQAIKKMVVRGAPAIGVAAAFGMVLGAKQSKAKDLAAFLRDLRGVGHALVATRPTAVNLLWAVERMKRTAEENIRRGIPAVKHTLQEEAVRILQEDIQANREIGRQGQMLIPDGASILTHCNAGALATAGYGTALGVIRAACAAGKRIHVFVDETRPFLQGARLTSWELMKDRIPCTLIADNMAGWLMAQGKIDLVIVGADRIVANGDVANKIGTYSLARLCAAHRIPFYVAAPTSTIDLSVKSGKAIPIEERPEEEITRLRGRPIAPRGMKALNPAFDVTPHRYIRAIITEKGIIQKPFRNGLKKTIRFNRRDRRERGEIAIKCR